MLRDSPYPKRKSIRHPEHDYSTAGAYFVNICTHDHGCWLGAVGDNIAGLSDAGCIVAEYWQSLPGRFAHVILDVFVIMPNHFHGLLILREPDDSLSSLTSGPALPEIVRWFKTQSAKRIQRECPSLTAFRWQRSFYDRIVRNRREFQAIRNYILRNPSEWLLDDDYSSM